jgi:3-oxoacyl-[acyl-carrier-protein] synthase II
VDHINAGAGGWTDLDAWEARGLHEVFGQTVPVVSYKGLFGNTGAASGLLELAASALALQHGQLPATVNCLRVAPDCPILVHTGSPRPVTKPCAVKVSYTDRGQIAVVVIRKCES